MFGKESITIKTKMPEHKYYCGNFGSSVSTAYEFLEYVMILGLN